MAGGSYRVEVPKEIGRWIKLFDQMPEAVAEIGRAHWVLATDVFFSRTQEYVHILSGDLKSSGKSSVRRTAWWIVGEVSYGGGDVDYAVYEEARGGEHAFMARGWEATNQLFAQMVPLIFTEAFEKGQ